MTEAKIRVGILFGGQSAEHEISILSARNVLAALDLTRFEPLLIGIAKDGRWLVQDAQRLLASARDPRLVRIDDGPPAHLPQLPSTFGTPPPSTTRSIDVVFPVLHGTLGEDGAIQGLLEVAGIPYVGAGILGSAIGMDKDVMKRLLRDAGIPVTEFRLEGARRGGRRRPGDRARHPRG
jgi:D-alanine-D-alanine ligase